MAATGQVEDREPTPETGLRKRAQAGGRKGGPARAIALLNKGRKLLRPPPKRDGKKTKLVEANDPKPTRRGSYKKNEISN